MVIDIEKIVHCKVMFVELKNNTAVVKDRCFVVFSLMTIEAFELGV